MARFLVPITLMDYATAIDRADVIAQFADSDPPVRRGRSLPLFVIARTPAGQVEGQLEYP